MAAESGKSGVPTPEVMSIEEELEFTKSLRLVEQMCIVRDIASTDVRFRATMATLNTVTEGLIAEHNERYENKITREAAEILAAQEQMAPPGKKGKTQQG